MDQDKIGKFIAHCRKEHNMTQVQFAQKLGVTNKSVSKWETGKCLPDVSLFNDICLLLNITLNEFFAGEKIQTENIAVKAEENLLSIAAEYQKRDYRLILNISSFGIGIGMLVASIAISNFAFKILWGIIALFAMSVSCYKIGVKGKRLLEITKIVSLVILAISILFTVDLGINYGNALLVEYHDGIVRTGFLSRIIYGDRGWSLHSFFQSFNNMLIISTLLVIENIILRCISIAKGRK